MHYDSSGLRQHAPEAGCAGSPPGLPAAVLAGTSSCLIAAHCVMLPDTCALPALAPATHCCQRQEEEQPPEPAGDSSEGGAQSCCFRLRVNCQLLPSQGLSGLSPVL